MGPPPRGVGWETPIGGQRTQQLELRMVNVMYGSTFTWNWLETLSDFFQTFSPSNILDHILMTPQHSPMCMACVGPPTCGACWVMPTDPGILSLMQQIR
jgi:hypothetical protein